MSDDPGPRPPARRAEREERIRTCVPARATRWERRPRDGRDRQETADQDWNVVRGED
ncbi:hypothetical protein [Streptomyces sp. AK02-01A]|uniref:hypothetical protein n=1 Tax=Streptomyces sp. AK02-01A TaxID=3028648 RepID=UPI0029B087AB|nr:hypothetical protein [Streptomyces sp. AK02-01A]MDX3854302.1 hypothetical protein [Streptomyces sp. AK02-01A]